MAIVFCPSQKTKNATKRCIYSGIFCYRRNRAITAPQSQWVELPQQPPLQQPKWTFSVNFLGFCSSFGPPQQSSFFVVQPSMNLCNKVSKHIKDIFYNRHHKHKETHIIGSCYSICALRVLYQAAAGSSKRRLKNSANLY